MVGKPGATTPTAVTTAKPGAGPSGAAGAPQSGAAAAPSTVKPGPGAAPGSGNG